MHSSLIYMMCIFKFHAQANGGAAAGKHLPPFFSSALMIFISPY
jgi:hypothetical protein